MPTQMQIIAIAMTLFIVASHVFFKLSTLDLASSVATFRSSAPLCCPQESVARSFG